MCKSSMFFYLPKICRQVPLLFLLPVYLHAESSLPSYGEARRALLRLWEQNYQAELKPTHIRTNPEEKGILCNRGGKKQVCYYHFRLRLARPYRAPKNKQDKRAGQDNMIISKPGQSIEAWLQCRAGSALKEVCQWSLYFLRRDLLPGKVRHWYKV